MSNRYLSAVMDFTDGLSVTEFSVLVCLADFASDDSRVAFSLVSTLERRAHVSRRTVFNVLEKLELDGWIAIKRRTGRSSSYQLLFDHEGRRLTHETWAEIDEQKHRNERARDQRGAPAARGGAPAARGGAPAARVGGAPAARGGAPAARGGAGDAPITLSNPGPIHKSDSQSPKTEEKTQPGPSHKAIQALLERRRRGNADAETEPETEAQEA